MFYCVKRDSGESETLAGLGGTLGGVNNPLKGLDNLSKAEIIRGIVREKLSTAAQEILAVVERTVSGFEDEAAGYRSEISRQKNQLDALLQPRVKLDRRDVNPDVDRHDVIVGAEEKQQSDAEEDSGSFQFEDGFDEEPSSVATTSQQTKLEPEFIVTPRSDIQRECVSESADHLDLRIRFLDDQQPDVLSNTVFKRCPVKVLRCPRGLEEKDFLLLMRSQIPQLSANENAAFDLFMTDRSRRLQPITVQRITAEEILKTEGNSALYVRLRTGEEEEEELHLEASADSPPVAVGTTSDQSQHRESVEHTYDQSSSRPSKRLKRSQEEADESHVDSSDEDNDDEGSNQQESDETDTEWKPDTEPTAPKARPKMASKSSSKKSKEEKPLFVENSKTLERTACKVCGVYYKNKACLIKHAWTHTQDRETESVCVCAKGECVCAEKSECACPKSECVCAESECVCPKTVCVCPKPVCVCGVCGNRFNTHTQLKDHLKSYQQTHRCSFCPKSFLSARSLGNHESTHGGVRPFKCDVCNKGFIHKSNLNVHRWVHIEDKPHKCDVCPRAFGLRAQLNAHAKTHTGRGDKFTCNICGMSVYDLRSLSRHRTTHSGERRHPCDVCDKRFKTDNALRMHKKMHAVRDRPFLCHICCKTFMSKNAMDRHEKTHTGERAFSCTVCGKGFISKGELKAHMFVHTADTPFKCTECGTFFKRKKHLDIHMSCHLGIKKFVCGVCGKACSRLEHLNVHMRTHNGERPYQCSLCERAFTQSHCLKTHMKSHVKP